MLNKAEVRGVWRMITDIKIILLEESSNYFGSVNYHVGRQSLKFLLHTSLHGLGRDDTQEFVDR